MARVSRSSKRSSRTGVLLCVTILPVAVQSVAAAPLGLVGQVTSRVTDNVTRVPSGEKRDLETRFLLGINHQSDPDVCNARTLGEVGYSRWYKDNYDPEVEANLDFLGDCQVTDRLSWQLTDSVRNVQQDSRLANTPDNTTQKNIFRTGPVYTMRLSSVDRLQLSAQYERSDYSESTEVDSDRLTGSAWINRDFSPTLNAGLRFTKESADLDTQEEIDRTSLSLTIAKQWNVSSLEGSIGQMNYESRRLGTEFKNDGIVGDVRYEREMSPSTLFYASASRELTDQTSAYDVQLGDLVFNLRETSGIDVVSFRAGIRNVYSTQSELDVALFYNQTDYFQTDREENSIGVRGRYLRPISPRLDGFVDGTLESLTYDPESRDDVQLDMEFGLTYGVSRKLRVLGSYGFSERTSDFAPAEYDENWIEVGLSYEFR